ncbi:MAG TPA: toll/interleukin-1 receptor domain-containing protein [Candidatus Polarisedimenticolaceae bacterium]|nr:toll/interleukin-1 receptor domain-containing protein [Candidatus Polarisedimenticolaceae bacterium]
MLYDVFICHASEDKDEIARPLATALASQHIEVWYDEFSLRLGDSLRESIDRGLARSRHGLVVLSEAFFSKRWPQWELNGLVARQMRGDERVIIPIWHKVSRDDVLEFSSPLADLVAVSTDDGIPAVCREILRVVRPQESPLVVARDELIAFGVSPPVISDEWWLDIIEASNRMLPVGFHVPDEVCWGRWAFPLPNHSSRGGDRGVRLAWTALQLRWVEQAEARRITQISDPCDVLAFVKEMPGLEESCHRFPSWLASYAPQLTIPGLSGEMETLFDEAMTKDPGDDAWALRVTDPDSIDAVRAACQFVQGDVGGPCPKFYETFDYLIWLLSEESAWLPQAHRSMLVRGIAEWGVWPNLSEPDRFMKWVLNLPSNPRRCRPPRNAVVELEALIARSLAATRTHDDPHVIAEKFSEAGIVKRFASSQYRGERFRSKRRSTRSAPKQ